jgi:non-specific serine/threonine protein kinase
VREFAQEMLDARGEAPQARYAHGAFFLGVAEEAEPHLTGKDQIQWLNRLEAEHANLHAALEFFAGHGMTEQALRLAGALGGFWWRHGHFHEGRQWLERLLAVEAAHSGLASDSVRAKAFTAAGVLAWTRGDFAQAAVWHETARNAFAAAGDERGLAFSLYQLGNAAKMQGDMDLATTCYESSLDRYWAMVNAWGMAALRHALAALALDTGDFRRSEALLAGEVAAARATGDRWLLGATLCNLGMAVARQGDLDRAAPQLAEALELMRSVGERRWIAHIRSFQGLLDGWQGDRVAALTAFREALLLAQELDVRFYCIEVIERIAALLVAIGQPASAVRLFAAASSWRRTIHAPALPADRDDSARAIAAARAALAAQSFNEAWAAGDGLSSSDVVAEALTLTAEMKQAGSGSAPVSSKVAPMLTARERDVLVLVCKRYTDAEIAGELFISRRTVHHHVANILGKFGAANRREVGAIAARLGLAAADL